MASHHTDYCYSGQLPIAGIHANSECCDDDIMAIQQKCVEPLYPLWDLPVHTEPSEVAIEQSFQPRYPMGSSSHEQVTLADKPYWPLKVETPSDTMVPDLYSLSATSSTGNSGNPFQVYTPQAAEQTDHLVVGPAHGQTSSSPMLDGDSNNHASPAHVNLQNDDCGQTTSASYAFDTSAACSQFGSGFSDGRGLAVSSAELDRDWSYLQPDNALAGDDSQFNSQTPRFSVQSPKVLHNTWCTTPLLSPGQMSTAKTPRIGTIHDFKPVNSTSSGFLQTPNQAAISHNRRFSNPSGTASPAFSITSPQTWSMSQISTPQSIFSGMGTPSSVLTSPDSTAPHVLPSPGQRKAMYPPSAYFRPGPYTLDRAQRIRRSWGESMTLPSRIKPRLGHSLSESFVPQLSSQQHPFSPLPMTGNIQPLSATWRPLGRSFDFGPPLTQALPSIPASGIATHQHPDNPFRIYQPPVTSVNHPDAMVEVSAANAGEPFFARPSSPPPEDMEAAEPWRVVVREGPKFDGDIYTPMYKRKNGQGATWEGWCGIGSCARWLSMKNSRYWEDKWSNHGICQGTRTHFEGPVEMRGETGVGKGQEGRCGYCDEWTSMNTRRRRMLGWWAHAHKCHPYSKRRMRKGLDAEVSG